MARFIGVVPFLGTVPVIVIFSVTKALSRDEFNVFRDIFQEALYAKKKISKQRQP